MAGAASSSLRSAYVAETTAGTTPATPGFTTLHTGALMKAIPEIVDGRSLIAKGARLGHGIHAIPVTGQLRDAPLVYGVYDDLLQTLLQGTWSSNVLKDAKDTNTVTIENTIPAGNGGTNTMMRYRGVEAVSGTLNLQSRQVATLSMEFLGRGSDDATTTAITGATYTDPTEFDQLSSGSQVGTIAFSGYTLDCMQSLEVSFAFENRDEQPKISSDDLCGVTRGDFIPTLKANMYIEANFLAIYNAARSSSHSAFSVTVPLGSVSGEKYTLVFPSCHFGSTELDFTGAEGFQMIDILPKYDTATNDSVVVLTRAVA